MSALVLTDGSAIVFEPMFGPRQVVLVTPARLPGTGIATIGGRPVCVVGDEKREQWQAQYFMPGYAPGTGTVVIDTLDSTQMAPCTTSGAALILDGQAFVARFTPRVPAVMNQPPNTPDSPAPSMGRGCFMPSQTVVRAG